MALCAPWIAEEDLPADRPQLPAGGPSWADLCLIASEALYRLSGERWTGDCGPRTAVLAAADRLADTYGAAGWCCGTGQGYPWEALLPQTGLPLPAMVSGQIYNVSCCAPQRVRLPDASARAVTAVRERGQARDPSSYRLARGGWLIDRSGRGWWTCGGHLEVDYTAGWPPPPGGRDAARLLAVELGRARAGGQCALPGAVASQVRQGVTLTMTTALATLKAGQVGLYPVDLWLMSVNRPARGSAVWSPDLPTATRFGG